jgi:3-oxoacyl-[acyl-carrier protein] reductase
MIRKPDGQAPLALVTGGGRGIGRAIAVDLAAAGCVVAVNYLNNREAAEGVVAAIRRQGGRAEAFRADVGDPAMASALVAAVEAGLGPVDVLVNNAGIGRRLDPFTTDQRYFDEVLNANVRSVYQMTQAVIAGMRDRQWGRLIFVSSLAARTGGIISAPYAASKAAVEGLMHYYATHLLPFHVTANAVAPALVDTDIFAGIALPPASALPLGRLGRPEEVARVVTMLVATEYVTGQTIQISAGRYHT